MLKHLSVSSSNSVHLHLKISLIGNNNLILLNLLWSGQFPINAITHGQSAFISYNWWLVFCLFYFLLLFVFLYGLFHVPLFGNWKEENPRGFGHTPGISVISPCHLVVGDFQRTIVIAYIRGVEREGGRHVTSTGQWKKSESPKGIETMTFRTPVGCSNHWATEDSWRMGHIWYTRFMHDMRPAYC